MNEIRVSAKTYDEAVTNALIQLQASSDNVTIKVLEEGNAGLFGVFGAKPWVISAVLKEEEEPSVQEYVYEEPEIVIPEEKAAEEPKPAEAEAKKAPKKSPKKEAPKKEAPKKETPVKEEVKEAPKAAEKAAETEAPAEEAEAAQIPEEEKRTVAFVSEEKAAELADRATAFLKDIFGIMELQADMVTSFDHTENELGIVMSGEDMGMLIGKRGQTLDSIQYLTSLVVNKHEDTYIRVKLDTENYRERRKEKLEELARHIAQKVKKSRKRVELEPMNPYERRIIHSALQSDPYVTTTSEGEEPYRHVVVLLKKEPRRRSYGRRS